MHWYLFGEIQFIQIIKCRPTTHGLASSQSPKKHNKSSNRHEVIISLFAVQVGYIQAERRRINHPRIQQ